MTMTSETDIIPEWDDLPTHEVIDQLLGLTCPEGIAHHNDQLDVEGHRDFHCFFVALAIKRIRRLVMEAHIWEQSARSIAADYNEVVGYESIALADNLGTVPDVFPPDRVDVHVSHRLQLPKP